MENLMSLMAKRNILTEKEIIGIVGQLSLGHTLMSVGHGLKEFFGKNNVNFSLSPMAYYRITINGKVIIIVNKKYAEEAELIVNNIAIGYEGQI